MSDATSKDPRRWWALAVLALAQLMIVLDATIVNVALPRLQEDLGLAEANRQWVVTAYTLAFGGLLLLGGRIADYMGARRVFLVGLAGFGAASALGGAAQSEGLLLAARALQGVFGALLAPAALSILTQTFEDPRERARAFGVFGAVAGSGAAIGMVLGGALTEYLDWRWCFFVNLPIAAVVLLGSLPSVRETRVEGKAHYDVPGALLVTGGLVALVYGFNRAEVDSWSAALTIGLLAGGAAMLVLFVVVERLVRHPLLPPRVLAERNRAGANLAITMLMLGLVGVSFLLTFYLQQVQSYSPFETGLLFLPVPGAVILSMFAVTRLMMHVRSRFLVAPGLVLFALGLLWLTRLTPDSAYETHVLPALILQGLGLALVMGVGINTATYRVEPADAGVASATVNTTQQIGGSIGTALLASIAATITADRIGAMPPPEAIVEGYTVAAAWAAAILGAAAIVVLALIDAEPMRPHDQPAEDEPSDGSRTIAGRVRQASGALVGDAAVMLIDRAGAQVARGWTDAEGHFALQAPERGRHVLVVRASAHQPHASVVEAGEGRLQADVVLTGSSGVAGVVRSATGAPVLGASVTITDEHGHVIASQTTEADGAYELADLVAGTYTVVVSAEAFRPVARLLIAPEGGTAREDIKLAGGGRLHGTARGGRDGRPLPDAHVALIDEEGAVVAVGRSGGDGRFEFGDLPQGTYTVVASSYPPSSAMVHLPAGEERECDVELDYPDGWRPAVRPLDGDSRSVASTLRAPESGISKPDER